MRKILLILLFPLAAYHSVKAQNIGINSTGATPNASAMLDIVAADKGLLIPRVALTATNAAGPVTSPATSLLVYNTATAGTSPNDVVPGYYFWSGSAWTPLAGSGGTGWNLDGNSLTAIKNFGTISAHDVPFITNNTEKMRLFSAGSLALGTATLNATNPEKFLVNAGVTTSYNLISAKGSLNNYLQMNIQNQSTGTAASSDIVATADNGTETVNYINMGINSSGYSSTGVLSGINNSYLYSTGNDMVIGNATINKNLIFFTNGTAVGDEKMRITADGNVGIGTSDFDPDSPEKFLIDAGDQNTALSAVGAVDDFLEINVQNISNGAHSSSDLVATANNGTENSVYVDLGINSAGYSNGASNILNGPNLAYLYANANDFKIGNGTPGLSLVFFTNPSSGTLGTNTANGVERMRINEAGNVGVGTTNPTSTLSAGGSVSFAYRVLSGNTTITATDHIVIYTGNGTHTWTVPAASTCAGRVYRIINQGSTNVTLSQSVTTSVGVTTTTLAANSSFQILSDGSVWRKIN